MIWLIAALALAVLGGLLILVLQMPDAIQKKRKKKKEPPPEPPKDWEAIAGRLEKRLQLSEKTVSDLENELKGRDKKLDQIKKALDQQQKQLEQEKIWREKEEAIIAKEKKQERLLQEELDKTRADLNTEATRRIKQDGELKELREAREALSAEERKLRSQVMQLDRSLSEALRENKSFKAENVELKKKKEDEEWVAKSDFKNLEGLLKRARWEVEQFKKKIPQAEWPKALQPKPAVSSSQVETPGGGPMPSATTESTASQQGA